jgi:uncharacterized protein (TIGR03083 family)
VLDPATYVDVVVAAIDGIAHAAEGNLDAPVEHCPEFDVARLLEHTGGFCRIVAGRVAGDEEWVPDTGTWQKAPAEEVAGDPIGWHERWGAELVVALRHSQPDEPLTTWIGHRTRYFWYRRAAQELTIHRWDVENARGTTPAIDAAIALDGIDEFLGEFGTRAANRLNGGGETYQFVVENTGQSFTVTAHPDRLVPQSPHEPAVVAVASADLLLRFLWGRASPDDLQPRGDRRLLERWHDLVRI